MLKLDYLSTTMLGDTAEKSKNPLKKAMRRRNAKTVTFNPPTYYDANEPDWSDIEAEIEGGVSNGNANHGRNGGAHVDREAIGATDGTSNAKREGAPNANNSADAKLGISDKGKQCRSIHLWQISDLSRCCGNPREEC